MTVAPGKRPTRRAKAGGYALGLARFMPIYHKYRKSTMLDRWSYVENLALVAATLINSDLATGAIVECGTWKGGMAAGLIEAGGFGRRYHFFDSFAGLPPAQDVDGESAKQWQADVTSPHYYDNCSASLEDFQRTIRMTGCPSDIVEVYPGFFDKTLPSFTPPPIAVLRLDADWYDSTMISLDTFWDHVMPGGLILVDDYFAWDGCSRAIHAFLAKRQAAERIHQSPLRRLAYILRVGAST